MSRSRKPTELRNTRKALSACGLRGRSSLLGPGCCPKSVGLALPRSEPAGTAPEGLTADIRRDVDSSTPPGAEG
eukprot:424989-Pyramimonas_sp.AAC.2